MKEEFLKELGVGEDAIEKILTRLNEESLENKIKESFVKNGVLDIDAAGVLLERDGISEDNYQERIESLKTLHPSIFKKRVPEFLGNADTLEKLDKSNFEKMSYKERLDLFKKNPTAYKKFAE